MRNYILNVYLKNVKKPISITVSYRRYHETFIRLLNDDSCKYINLDDLIIINKSEIQYVDITEINKN